MAITTYNSTLREWEDIIRVNLKVTNPALLKSGALGILTNYLAGIKYDNLSYYSKVFQEMNVGLAQDFNSLLYHSTIFGAKLQFAIPATLTSSLVIPELKLAQVEKLKYFIPKNTTFTDSNNLSFLVESDITVEITSATVRATSWDKEQGSKKLTVTRAPNPNQPGAYLYLINNNDIRQYKREFESFRTPSYNVGDSYNFSMGITDLSEIKAINAWVNTGDEIDLAKLDKFDTEDIEDIIEPGKNYQLEQYDIKFQKFNSSGQDHDLFLEIYENSLNFETGDGIHGVVIPENSQIIIELQTTKGRYGNVPNSEFLIRNVQVTEYYNGTNIEKKYDTSVNGLSTSGSTGGSTAHSTEDMRETILSKINTRNSIVTENDYENMFNYNGIKPFVDAKFIDAKAFVFLFNVIKDNDAVVPTTAINLREVDLMQDPFYPTYAYGGEILISPFYYKNKSPNTIDAYILNPRYVIDWKKAPNSPSEIDTNVYRVDLAITYDFTQRKSYIEIIDGAVEDYNYYFNSSQFGVSMILNQLNNFKLPIDDRYTDEFCILEEPLTDMTLNVEKDGEILASYVSEGPDHPLSLKQTFYKYFKEVESSTQPVYPIESSLGYLDNILNNTMSTVSNILVGDTNQTIETYLLRLPFLSQDYFYSIPAEEIFEQLDQYFMIDHYDEIINYNTQLTQTFHNTIDIPTRYHDFLFEKNNNGILSTPRIPINLAIYVDNDKFLTSQYSDTEDLRLQIKIFTIKFLKQYEGFMISYFESDLEKAIWNEFSPLLKNINVGQPQLFVVQNSATIYDSIQENLSFDDVLEFVPPYFYYDYNNIEVTLEI